MINIVSSSRYRLDRKLIQEQTQAALTQYAVSYETALNVVFVGKRKMREIASTYKNEDVALPVLSFSYKEQLGEQENLLGEVIICYPQAVLLAAERGKAVDQMLNALIVHGIENIMTK